MRIIRNNTKPRVRRILFHDPSEGHLRRTRHRIRLVQNDEFESPQPFRSRSLSGSAEDLFRRSERLNLFSHNIDASVVAGVEFEDHLTHRNAAVD